MQRKRWQTVGQTNGRRDGGNEELNGPVYSDSELNKIQLDICSHNPIYLYIYICSNIYIYVCACVSVSLFVCSPRCLQQMQ